MECERRRSDMEGRGEFREGEGGVEGDVRGNR